VLGERKEEERKNQRERERERKRSVQLNGSILHYNIVKLVKVTVYVICRRRFFFFIISLLVYPLFGY
jgi:hypothetical protein